MRIVVYLLLAATLGCASTTPQADHILNHTLDLPTVAHIENVPFIEQKVAHCGPATLAMAFNWAGRKTSADELAPLVMTPGMKGSFQTDMISATRRKGMLAIPIFGMQQLLREVASGNPVIVFENLSFSWLPTYHYAIVYGYDLEHHHVIMHSGPEKAKRWDLKVFERSWKLGNYWGLIVLPPGKLSSTASEMDHLRAAAALEQLEFKSEAQSTYTKMLEKWPTSLGAHIGLANIAYQKGEIARAAQILTRASQLHPQSHQVRHNLAIAQAQLQGKAPSSQ